MYGTASFTTEDGLNITLNGDFQGQGNSYGSSPTFEEWLQEVRDAREVALGAKSGSDENDFPETNVAPGFDYDPTAEYSGDKIWDYTGQDSIRFEAHHDFVTIFTEENGRENEILFDNEGDYALVVALAIAAGKNVWG